MIIDERLMKKLESGARLEIIKANKRNMNIIPGGSIKNSSQFKIVVPIK
jgi:hypothetical protein